MLGKGLQSLIPPKGDDDQKIPPAAPLPGDTIHLDNPAEPEREAISPHAPGNQELKEESDFLPVPFHEIALPVIQPAQPTISPDVTRHSAPPSLEPQKSSAAAGQSRTPASSNQEHSGPVSQMPHTTFSPARSTQPSSDQLEKNPEHIFNIETSRITSNPHQPRRAYDQNELHELALSIREYGILQPLVVTRIEHETPHGTQVEYQLIAGERRLLASKIAGLERVPAIIRVAPRDEREKLEMALIENIQRASLNPFDTARAYAKLQDQFGLSQREIAQRVGKSREVIANTIRLLQLPREAQTALTEGKINESHARILLSVSDPATQRAALEETLSKNLSVRELQMLLEAHSAGEPMHTALMLREKYDPEAEFVRQRLEEALGARVKIMKRGKKGKITINFFSDEELHNIIDKFTSDR